MSKTKTNRREKATSERSNSEVSRWLLGFALLSIGLFALASALFYFAHWKADFALLNGIGSDNPNFDLLEFSNPCGGGGAWIGDILIGRSFGAFGVVIPIFILLIGLKILRKQPLRLHRMALSSAMLLILGSLSLGFIFKESLAIFNSGLGGAYGISIAARLCGLIGSVGIAILLICGWVGFGVFVNRNFINTVNAAGQSAINRGGKIVDIVKDKVSSRGHTKESMLPEETTFNAHSREEEPSVAEVDAIDQKEVKEQQSPIVVEHPEQDDMLVVVEVEESASIEKIEPDLEIDRRCVEDEDLAVVDIVEPQSGLVVTVEANIAAQLTEDEVDDMELYDPLRDLNNYQHPPVNLLEDYQSKSEVSDEEIY
ncbi:MAG: DNA translocase FtsK 4TM domain-containing protein [Rikenellaceae bacterium]